MSYETTKRKIRKLSNANSDQEISTERINKYELRSTPENILKTPTVIKLIVGYNFTFGKVSTPFHDRVTVFYGGPDQIGMGGGGIGG